MKKHNNFVRMSSVGEEEQKVIDGVRETFRLLNSARATKGQKNKLVKMIRKSLEGVILSEENDNNNNRKMAFEAGLLLVRFPNKEDKVIVDNSIAIIEDLAEKNPKLQPEIITDLSCEYTKRIVDGKEGFGFASNDFYAIEQSAKLISRMFFKDTSLTEKVNIDRITDPFKLVEVKDTSKKGSFSLVSRKRSNLINGLVKSFKKANDQEEKKQLKADMTATKGKLKSGVAGMRKQYALKHISEVFK